MKKEELEVGSKMDKIEKFKPIVKVIDEFFTSWYKVRKAFTTPPAVGMGEILLEQQEKRIITENEDTLRPLITLGTNEFETKLVSLSLENPIYVELLDIQQRASSAYEAGQMTGDEGFNKAYEYFAEFIKVIIKADEIEITTSDRFLIKELPKFMMKRAQLMWEENGVTVYKKTKESKEWSRLLKVITTLSRKRNPDLDNIEDSRERLIAMATSMLEAAKLVLTNTKTHKGYKKIDVKATLEEFIKTMGAVKTEAEDASKPIDNVVSLKELANK